MSATGTDVKRDTEARTFVEQGPQKQSAEEQQPKRRFTTFFDHIRSVSGSLFGEAEAVKMVNQLRGKTEAELKGVLKTLFEGISDSQLFKDSDFKAGAALQKLEAFLNYVASIDDKNNKISGILSGIKNKEGDKRKNYLALLTNSRFIARCAKVISWATQEQLDTILQQSNDFFSGIRSSRAQHMGVNDFGQFGVYLVRLLFDLFKVLATQKGYDMSSLETSEEARPSNFMFVNK